MLWLVFAPFNASPSLAAKPGGRHSATSGASSSSADVPNALKNSVILVVITTALVLAIAAPASYALSRIQFKGRNLFLYSLLLLSSVVTGAAAILPLFMLLFSLGRLDTFDGVSFALAGGLLPAAIFILKDFTDSIPRSYEESARVFGASSFQALRHVSLPVVRPGLAVIAVWTAVPVWSNFLVRSSCCAAPTRVLPRC